MPGRLWSRTHEKATSHLQNTKLYPDWERIPVDGWEGLFEEGEVWIRYEVDSPLRREVNMPIDWV